MNADSQPNSTLPTAHHSEHIIMITTTIEEDVGMGEYMADLAKLEERNLILEGEIPRNPTLRMKKQSDLKWHIDSNLLH